MKTRHLCGVTALALSAALAAFVARAQTADEPNEGVHFATDPGVTNGYQISWWGRTGRTYFLQHSEDLTGLWSYFPIIEFGHDAPLSYGFVNESPLIFARVSYLDQVLADPFNTDSDGDGLTNQQEFDAKTDPFKTDTDGDGMPDKWELNHGFNPRDPADALADANGNSVSNLDEFINGNDPRQDAYAGVKPTLTIISGNGQIPVPGRFLPLPMRVRVYYPDGTPWAGVPLHFRADVDEGLLAATPAEDAPLRRTYTIYSDQNGYAQIWIKTQ
jgi:hypothetical protein